MGQQNEIKYPIYIISKGRYYNPLTAKMFMNENIPFIIAVEPQEYEKYCNVIPEKFVAKLPFSNLGLGSYPARNWCWQDSINKGYKKHYLFDDNIRNFVNFNKGKKIKCFAIDGILSLQKFVEKYKNIAIAGWNYRYFVTSETKKPFTYNTHVYSGMLINNEIPFKWRLKYDEDVDLCLQALHNRWNTILLNVYLIEKTSTVKKMKGGNQDELYKNNDYNKKLLKAKSLEQVWPQYVKTVIRYGRPHHYVNWKKHFKHTLIRK
jgi:hypothetical protein